jgi:hypothetical protein
MNQTTPAAPPIGVDEFAMAQALDVSVAWLRKDRRSARIVPFYKIGKHCRYNLERVREALAAVECGGNGKVRK